MDALIPLLLLSACCYAYSEPLSAAIKRRSDYGVYASDYTRDYEPMAYVAIPLHKPLPVMHILTNSPLQDAKKVRRSPQIQRFPPHKYTTPQPAYGQRIYASSMGHSWYSKPNNQEPEPISEPVSPPMQPLVFFAQPSSSNQEPMVLYARPNKYGGYSYRKPAKKTVPKKEPIIIRVHKYRIIKDDR